MPVVLRDSTGKSARPTEFAGQSRMLSQVASGCDAEVRRLLRQVSHDLPISEGSDHNEFDEGV